MAAKKKWENEEYKKTQGKAVSIALKEKWKDPLFREMVMRKRKETKEKNKK